MDESRAGPLTAGPRPTSPGTSPAPPLRAGQLRSSSHSQAQPLGAPWERCVNESPKSPLSPHPWARFRAQQRTFRLYRHLLGRSQLPRHPGGLIRADISASPEGQTGPNRRVLDVSAPVLMRPMRSSVPNALPALCGPPSRTRFPNAFRTRCLPRPCRRCPPRGCSWAPAQLRRDGDPGEAAVGVIEGQGEHRDALVAELK